MDKLSIDPHWANHLYFDREMQRKAVKVQPGEFYAANKDSAITTVLGSCVSVCLLDLRQGVCGLNHIMLPEPAEHLLSPSARYGSYAMEMLINSLLQLGAKRANFQAKVFGGGNVMHSNLSQQVGARNVAFVRQYLNREAIPVMAENVLGTFPRKIVLLTRTGEVKMKRLGNWQQAKVIEQEQSFRHQLDSTCLTGQAELFQED